MYVEIRLNFFFPLTLFATGGFQEFCVFLPLPKSNTKFLCKSNNLKAAAGHFGTFLKLCTVYLMRHTEGNV